MDKYLKENVLLIQLSSDELNEIKSIVQIKTYQKEEVIIEEGDLPSCFYLIFDGKVSIYTENGSTKIAQCLPGGEVGFMSLIDGLPRTATVIADEPTYIGAINLQDLKKLPSNQDNKLYQKMIENYSKKSRQDITNVNVKATLALKNEIQLEKKRNIFANVFIFVTLTNTIYLIFVRTIVQLQMNAGVTTFLTSGLLVIFVAILIVIVSITKVPLSYFGLNLNNFKNHVIQAINWTILFIITITFLKWLYISFFQRGENTSLFEWTEYYRAGSFSYSLVLILIYSGFTFVQELIARGLLQGSLQDFLPGNHKNTKAIVYSTIIFSSTHLHLGSMIYPLVVIIPSLFWGALYAKQRSLVGVTLSHSIIGSYAGFVMGFPGA